MLSRIEKYIEVRNSNGGVIPAHLEPQCFVQQRTKSAVEATLKLGVLYPSLDFWKSCFPGKEPSKDQWYTITRKGVTIKGILEDAKYGCPSGCYELNDVFSEEIEKVHEKALGQVVGQEGVDKCFNNSLQQNKVTAGHNKDGSVRINVPASSSSASKRKGGDDDVEEEEEPTSAGGVLFSKSKKNK